MNSKKIYTKLLLASSLILMGGAMTSCDDYLTLLPTDQLPEENFWQDKSDLDGVRAGAYSQLAKASQTEKILQWGELRSDNLSLNNVSNTAVDNLQNAVLQPSEGMFDWSGFYTGINYCNLVLEKGLDMTVPGKEVDPSFTRADYRSYRAEMLALRSLYYFYLVRSFRDVPYVTKSVRTDAEARASKSAAVPGVAILGECIDSLEANVNYAAKNLGSDADNCGRFTKKGIKALLADMCLWRACMLKDYVSKENTAQINMDDIAVKDENGNVTGYTTKDGKTINNALCIDFALAYLEKAYSYSLEVIDILYEKYWEELQKNLTSATAEQKTQPYPLYLNERKISNGIIDNSYLNNFGSQNSLESVFELQYDGTTMTNGTVNNYLSTYSNNTFTPGTMVLSNNLLSSVTSVDPEIGFGKSDLRLLETCYYPYTGTEKPVSKFVTQHFSVTSTEDMSQLNSFSNISGRTSSSNNAHWPVYRLTDVMLIKAEAIARLGLMSGSISEADLKEGYKLINEIFKRNNPALVTPAEAQADANKLSNNLYSDRLNEDYNVTGKSATTLLSNVYRERQREFVAEGKRWYDIVRQAEFSYVANQKSTSSALAFGSFKQQVTNRLSKLYSLYNPIYSEELKVNGKGQADGGKLVQNPIWDRYTKK